jgi:hypothetical protein
MGWLRDALADRFPALRFGYFNPVVRAKRRGVRAVAAAAV